MNTSTPPGPEAEPLDRVRDEYLPQMARTGDAYKNEVRAMARELIERRKKATDDLYAAAYLSAGFGP